ncbi:hypothetical protein HC928_04170 [bacterium]|nr:hypothetical protein [bacterium]
MTMNSSQKSLIVRYNSKGELQETDENEVKSTVYSPTTQLIVNAGTIVIAFFSLTFASFLMFVMVAGMTDIISDFRVKPTPVAPFQQNY